MLEFRKVLVFLAVGILLFYMLRLVYFTKKKWKYKKYILAILMGGLASVFMATFLDMIVEYIDNGITRAMIRIFLSLGSVTYIIGVILWTKFTVDMMTKLETATTTDYMTGALNRSGLEKVYTSLMETKSPFYTLVCDLDGTKNVNDTFGHIEGDRYIRRVTEIITSIIDSRGYLARTGGDEFVIVLEYIAKQELENIISDIKNKVYAIYKVSRAGISIGYSEYPKDGEDLRELVEIADKRMYSDKKTSGGSRK